MRLIECDCAVGQQRCPQGKGEGQSCRIWASDDKVISDPRWQRIRDLCATPLMLMNAKNLKALVGRIKDVVNGRTT